MLRVYFVQQWYRLADEAVENASYDSQALRGFADIELNRDPMPDATTGCTSVTGWNSTT
jgi:transposase, IS5 family